MIEIRIPDFNNHSIIISKQHDFKDILNNYGNTSKFLIDELNIYEASRKAMIKAYEEANKKVKIDYLLTDAMPITTLDIPVLKIIKGDAKSVTIAAASILAKVTRDRIIDSIWEWTGNDVNDNTITVYMKRIREKLNSDIIVTIKGIGYRIDEE